MILFHHTLKLDTPASPFPIQLFQRRPPTIFLTKLKFFYIFDFENAHASSISTNHAQLRSLGLEIGDELNAKNRKREIVSQNF